MLLSEITQPQGIQGIIQTVTQALSAQGHDFNPQVNVNNEAGSAEFTCAVTNRRGVQDEQYQTSSKALNTVLDPIFRQLRSAGYTFTQPVGVPGTATENADYTTMKMSFTVGMPQQQAPQQQPAEQQVTPQQQQAVPQQ